MRSLPRIALAAAAVLAAALGALALYRYVETAAPVGRPAGNDGLALALFEPPRPLPEIRFADDKGRSRTIGDFKGRVVLLNFWATWCVPCRKEMPALDRLAEKIGGKDFVVLPISIDRNGAAAVKPFYKQLGLERLGIYLDPQGLAAAALKLPGVPTTLLIDRNGAEVARKMGEAEWDSAKMIALIRRYLPPDTRS
jgi:thiol-disulfide isomerase/thioredoxin